MRESALRKLYIDELRDIYNAEDQLTKVLPKMTKAANSDELRYWKKLCKRKKRPIKS